MLPLISGFIEFRVGYLEYLPLVKSFGVILNSESGLDLIFATEMNWDLVSVSRLVHVTVT